MAVPISQSQYRQSPFRASLLPNSSNYAFHAALIFNYSNVHLKKTATLYRRDRVRNQMRSSLNDCDKVATAAAGRNIWRESEFVEVIGIGSRVDSVLDFCLSSQTPSQSVRYWNVARRDSSILYLEERPLRKDGAMNIAEARVNQKSSFKAVVLVAGAGYGEEHVATLDILKAIKSAGGLAVAVILKPFNFEGLKRQKEVRFLLGKLQDFTDFCLEIDIDTLLKMDLVTLDEALRTTNRAVYFAISAVNVLISDNHKKLFDSPGDSSKELATSELVKVLNGYAVGEIGFGAAHSVESSIRLAVYDCPFLSVGLKDLDGIVICITSSASVDDGNDLHAILNMFRQTTAYHQKIIISVIRDPNLQPGVIATTVITVCSPAQKSPPKNSILSRLAENIPSVFNFLRRYNLHFGKPEQSATFESTTVSKLKGSQDKNDVSKIINRNAAPEDFALHSDELQMLLNEDSDKMKYDNDEATEPQCSDAGEDPSMFDEQKFEGTQGFQREPIGNWNFEPGCRIIPEQIGEGASISASLAMANTPSIFSLPVGVRPSEDLKYCHVIPNSRLNSEPKTKDDVKTQPRAADSMDFGSATIGIRKRHLSVRAASMLNTERDSTRRWSRMMEIGYKGGIYKGYCQGGLPEGRGRLTLPDGSVYDGMWRYGKRSGLGTFNFSNGDVFQGSWRDDLMHGKGWFYFHNGDRWFANFWKGRANGEGRFYSESGEIFFGHFRDGWRDGHFFCVKADGTRYVEIWSEGVCKSCEQLDNDSSSC